MKRYTTAVSLVLAGLLLGGLAGVWWTGAQSDTTPILQLYSDGTWRCAGGGLDCLVLAPPAASATPTTSLTPTIPPTNTPRPTASSTPAPEATPTPEPGTPAPTTTPPLGACQGNVINAAGLTLRTDHSATASMIRVLPTGETVTITGFYVYSDAVNEWAHVRTQRGETGWLAAYFYTPPKRMLSWDDANEVCLPPYVTVEYDSNPLPVKLSLFGTHHIVGARESPVIALTPLYGTIKTTTSSETVALLLKSIRPDVTWVHRSLYVDGWMRDGPTPEEWNNPILYAQKVEQQWYGGADFYEFMNEVIPPDWATFVRFTQFILDYAGQRGTCLLWGSFGPGNPPIDVWPQLIPLMKWANEHPCGRNPDGSPRYHGIAWHSALYVPEAFARGAYVTPPLKLWIVERHLLVNATLKDYGFEFALYRGPIYVTELGIDNGYAGAPEQYSCDEYAQSVALTIQEYKRLAPYITGFHLWNFGGSGIGWVNREECADEILRWVGQ